MQPSGTVHWLPLRELKEIRIIATAHIQGPKLNHWASDAAAPGCLCMERVGGVQALVDDAVDDAIDDAVAPSIFCGKQSTPIVPRNSLGQAKRAREGGEW